MPIARSKREAKRNIETKDELLKQKIRKIIIEELLTKRERKPSLSELYREYNRLLLGEEE